MDPEEDYEAILRKYRHYQRIPATRLAFLTKLDGEYCRIDGISEPYRAIMSIVLDYQLAKNLKDALEKWIKDYEERNSYFG